MKKLNYKIAAVVIFMIWALSSCDHPEYSGKYVKSIDTVETAPVEIQRSFISDVVTRAKVLENNTITYVRLIPAQKLTLRPNDTVWVNLVEHVIDDTSNTTMKCVLLK